MITLPIWAFVLMCLCVAIDVIELGIFLWAIICACIENKREAKEAEIKEAKLKESLRIAEIMNPDENPEYIPREFRKESCGNWYIVKDRRI